MLLTHADCSSSILPIRLAAFAKLPKNLESITQLRSLFGIFTSGPGKSLKHLAPLAPLKATSSQTASTTAAIKTPKLHRQNPVSLNRLALLETTATRTIQISTLGSLIKHGWEKISMLSQINHLLNMWLPLRTQIWVRPRTLSQNSSKSSRKVWFQQEMTQTH